VTSSARFLDHAEPSYSSTNQQRAQARTNASLPSLFTKSVEKKKFKEVALALGLETDQE